MTTQYYDAIVLGAGQGGGPLAASLAAAGRRTALIERDYVGGTCVNTGCTPTKAMLASARVAHLSRSSDDYGVETGDVVVHFDKVQQRKNRIVKSFRQSSRESYENTENLDLLMGEGAFTAAGEDGLYSIHIHMNQGEDRTISGKYVFINTGGHASIPPITGIDQIEALDEAALMELDHLPDHLAILGGGYVGIEFAQMYRRFGSEITVIEMEDQILSLEDKDVADNLADILRDDGINILTSSTLQKITPRQGGMKLQVETPDDEREIEASHLLVAVGRTPNTARLNLDAVGVQLDERGHIEVDEYLHTNVPNIYAMGDVKGGPEFTHIAYDDFRVLRDQLLRESENSIAGRMVPYVVFTDPQLGRVGLNEKQAHEQGIPHRVAQIPLSSVARAIEVDQTRGMMKAIIADEDDQILGCTIVSPQGGEIMTMIQIAMIGGLPYTRLRDAILAHPTFAESLNSLFSSVRSKTPA